MHRSPTVASRFVDFYLPSRPSSTALQVLTVSAPLWLQSRTTRYHNVTTAFKQHEVTKLYVSSCLSCVVLICSLCIFISLRLPVILFHDIHCVETNSIRWGYFPAHTVAAWGVSGLAQFVTRSLSFRGGGKSSRRK